MAVIRRRCFDAGDHLGAEHFNRLTRGQGHDLRAADALELVQAAVGLCHGFAGHHHTVVFHEKNGLVAQARGQSLTFFQTAGQALVVVVIGNLPVKESGCLAGRNQAVVLEHIERHGPMLMRVQNHIGARDAVQRRMNALR